MTRRWYVVVVGCVVAVALIPWIAATVANHGALRVPPEFTDDSVYYYSRIHTVVDGHPFIGNPYFKEHREEIASAFFGADWIAAAPLMLHVPLIPVIILDTIIGFVAFTGLVIILCISLGMSRWGIILSLVTMLSESFWFLERPVSMQVVFPVFLLFLLFYYWYLKRPQSYSASGALIVASVLSFYTYTYLWQIVVIIVGLTHLVFFTKARRNYRSLLFIDATTGILAFPLFWYTYHQLHHPWYWQTMTRTGLVATHTIGSTALVAAVVTLFIGTTLWILESGDATRRIERTFFAVVGGAILIAVFSNVITGKDLESANHFIRFTYLWAALAGSYALYSYIQSHGFEWRSYLHNNRALVALVALVAFFSFNVYQVTRGFQSVASPSILASQVYDAPTQWLNHNAPAESVVFADDALSYYIPLMTHDYILFQPDGGLYLVSDREVQDRYLASRMFHNLSLSDIERDVRLYAGVGNALDAYKTLNRGSEVCRLFMHSLGACPPLLTPVSYLGVPYFTDMVSRYQSEVVAHPEETLRGFEVAYIIKDTVLDTTIHPERLQGWIRVATIGRFEIYTLSATGTAIHS